MCFFFFTINDLSLIYLCRQHWWIRVVGHLTPYSFPGYWPWFPKYHIDNRCHNPPKPKPGLSSRAEAEYHINVLELLWVKLGLMSWLGLVSNQQIRIMSGNTIAISYFNTMGGCRNKECNAIAKEIWLWVMKRDTWLSAAHQPGRLNTTADSLSRILKMV